MSKREHAAISPLLCHSRHLRLVDDSNAIGSRKTSELSYRGQRGPRHPATMKASEAFSSPSHPA